MKRNVLEWAILAVSVVALVALVGYLALDALTRSTDEPVIVVEVGSGELGEFGWLVPLTIVNEGGGAVRRLTVEATATVDGTNEASPLTIDILPPGSSVDTVAGFSGPPDGPVTTRVLSYEVP